MDKKSKKSRLFLAYSRNVRPELIKQIVKKCPKIWQIKISDYNNIVIKKDRVVIQFYLLDEWDLYQLDI